MYNDYELFQMGLLLGGVGVGGVVSSLFDYLSYLLLPAVESGVVFYWYGLTLIPEWISSHMTSKKWNEITYPFPNDECDRLSMLRLKNYARCLHSIVFCSDNIQVSLSSYFSSMFTISQYDWKIRRELLLSGSDVHRSDCRYH